ncbi:hypothetical protein VOLCADRAFT_87430 [Volvox carteri f. nagariensis]|uniref:Uncharacterized protein n=1 Tax=Volvox carteri f. nagariensis TaxID=3068 RepID=D8TLB6_VOLCA|nr:uncharacterized protein VOLCADRAFT_87430 [Volvox carteri f. nagariensis]EFJ51844.1 hypothetical protein VOLCADRAFT_87430 [Volvox carteri f. nagariensis]|eukprot:XP_002947254.1 hypothetical protein VOLCADRAFT_87430 [Volvox carteri f. nagariensis]
MTWAWRVTLCCAWLRAAASAGSLEAPISQTGSLCPSPPASMQDAMCYRFFGQPAAADLVHTSAATTARDFGDLYDRPHGPAAREAPVQVPPAWRLRVPRRPPSGVEPTVDLSPDGLWTLRSAIPVQQPPLLVDSLTVRLHLAGAPYTAAQLQGHLTACPPPTAPIRRCDEYEYDGGCEYDDAAAPDPKGAAVVSVPSSGVSYKDRGTIGTAEPVACEGGAVFALPQGSEAGGGAEEGGGTLQTMEEYKIIFQDGVTDDNSLASARGDITAADQLVYTVRLRVKRWDAEEQVVDRLAALLHRAELQPPLPPPLLPPLRHGSSSPPPDSPQQALDLQWLRSSQQQRAPHRPPAAPPPRLPHGDSRNSPGADVFRAVNAGSSDGGSGGDNDFAELLDRLSAMAQSQGLPDGWATQLRQQMAQLVAGRQRQGVYGSGGGGNGGGGSDWRIDRAVQPGLPGAVQRVALCSRDLYLCYNRYVRVPPPPPLPSIKNGGGKGGDGAGDSGEGRGFGRWLLSFEASVQKEYEKRTEVTAKRYVALQKAIGEQMDAYADNFPLMQAQGNLIRRTLNARLYSAAYRSAAVAYASAYLDAVIGVALYRKNAELAINPRYIITRLLLILLDGVLGTVLVGITQATFTVTPTVINPPTTVISSLINGSFSANGTAPPGVVGGASASSRGVTVGNVSTAAAALGPALFTGLLEDATRAFPDVIDTDPGARRSKGGRAGKGQRKGRRRDGAGEGGTGGRSELERAAAWLDLAEDVVGGIRAALQPEGQGHGSDGGGGDSSGKWGYGVGGVGGDGGHFGSELFDFRGVSRADDVDAAKTGSGGGGGHSFSRGASAPSGAVRGPAASVGRRAAQLADKDVYALACLIAALQQTSPCRTDRAGSVLDNRQAALDRTAAVMADIGPTGAQVLAAINRTVRSSRLGPKGGLHLGSWEGKDACSNSRMASDAAAAAAGQLSAGLDRLRDMAADGLQYRTSGPERSRSAGSTDSSSSGGTARVVGDAAAVAGGWDPLLLAGGEDGVAAALRSLWDVWFPSGTTANSSSATQYAPPPPWALSPRPPSTGTSATTTPDALSASILRAAGTRTDNIPFNTTIELPKPAAAPPRSSGGVAGGNGLARGGPAVRQLGGEVQPVELASAPFRQQQPAGGQRVRVWDWRGRGQEPQQITELRDASDMPVRAQRGGNSSFSAGSAHSGNKGGNEAREDLPAGDDRIKNAAQRGGNELRGSVIELPVAWGSAGHDHTAWAGQFQRFGSPVPSAQLLASVTGATHPGPSDPAVRINISSNSGVQDDLGNQKYRHAGNSKNSDTSTSNTGASSGSDNINPPADVPVTWSALKASAAAASDTVPHRLPARPAAAANPVAPPLPPAPPQHHTTIDRWAPPGPSATPAKPTPSSRVNTTSLNDEPLRAVRPAPGRDSASRGPVYGGSWVTTTASQQQPVSSVNTEAGLNNLMSPPASLPETTEAAAGGSPIKDGTTQAAGGDHDILPAVWSAGQLHARVRPLSGGAAAAAAAEAESVALSGVQAALAREAVAITARALDDIADAMVGASDSLNQVPAGTKALAPSAVAPGTPSISLTGGLARELEPLPGIGNPPVTITDATNASTARAAALADAVLQDLLTSLMRILSTLSLRLGGPPLETPRVAGGSRTSQRWADADELIVRVLVSTEKQLQQLSRRATAFNTAAPWKSPQRAPRSWPSG